MIAVVNCSKCGAKNADDAKFCVSCGATLYPERSRERREDECFGPRGPQEECFGLPHGGAIAGIIIGLFIVILGLALFLGQNISQLIGPFVLMLIGALIVAGAIYGLSRRGRY